MKNTIHFIAFTLFLTACGSKEDSAEKSQAPPPKMTVDVVKIEPGEVTRTISIPGSIIPSEEVQLYSEVTGRIQKINFKEGQLVSKGATLLVVDSDILKAQKAQLVVEFQLAKKDEVRKKTLLSAKGISEEEYEKSASQVDNIQAKMDLLNVQISKAIIKAPFSGRIGLRHISEGAFINSSTLITTLVQENPIKIEFAVSERYANKVAVGQTISFKPDSENNAITAKVFAYESMVNEGTRMLTIRAEANTKSKLVPGTFVSIDYDLGQEQNAFMVPTESIVPILKGQKVFVVRNGAIVEIPVEIGIRTADKVQIIGAVNSGDLVLISGLLAVRAGMPVDTKIIKK